MRRLTLERKGTQTIPISYQAYFDAFPGLLRGIQWRLRAGPAVRDFNRDLLKTADRERPDIVWIEKGVFVYADTIRHIKKSGSKIILYSPDNYFLAQNHSRHLWAAFPHYDLVVTTKSGAEIRLAERGARKILLSGNAYDDEIHRPLTLSNAEREKFSSDVAFIGRWEAEREEWLRAVIDEGVNLRIWGQDWYKAEDAIVRAAWNGPALAEDYPKAIAGAEITLCFLSRTAADTITQRSVEIPACGGFMLAERTADHQSHFTEGEEAAYFSGLPEMLSKIRMYLGDPASRTEIARKGRLRCESSRYSYDNRISEILQALDAE